MAKRRSPEMRSKIKEMHEENEFKSILDSRARARSITTGTAFGGTVEVTLRNEFTTMYALMQPVEVVEFIEQLAAGCGIEIAMRPKQNFTSWRGWNIDEDNINVYMKGSAPWSIDGQEHIRKLSAARQDAELELAKKELELMNQKQIKKLQKSLDEIENTYQESETNAPVVKKTRKRKQDISNQSETES